MKLEIEPCLGLGLWYTKPVTLVGTLSDTGPENGYLVLEPVFVDLKGAQTSSVAISTSETKLALQTISDMNWHRRTGSQGLLGHIAVATPHLSIAGTAAAQPPRTRPFGNIH